MITKADLFSMMEETQVVYLATANGKGKPFVRPLTLISLDGTFWIATGSSDSKMNQIAENGFFEFCLPIYTDDNGGYVRINGTIKIVKSIADKTMLHQSVDFIKMFWKKPTDKGYGLLKLDPEHIEYMRPGVMEAEHQDWKDMEE